MSKDIKHSTKKSPERKIRKRGRPRKTEIKEKAAPLPPIEKTKVKRRSYLFAVGRRKSAIARVRYYKKGTGQYLVNNKPVNQYFTTVELQMISQSPINLLSLKLEGDISVRVRGGGLRGQAESVRHGLARVLTFVDKNFRPPLKRAGFLKRDARVKERKKYGLKRARRAPQWQKR